MLLLLGPHHYVLTRLFKVEHTLCKNLGLKVKSMGHCRALKKGRKKYGGREV